MIGGSRLSQLFAAPVANAPPAEGDARQPAAAVRPRLSRRGASANAARQTADELTESEKPLADAAAPQVPAVASMPEPRRGEPARVEPVVERLTIEKARPPVIDQQPTPARHREVDSAREERTPLPAPLVVDRRPAAIPASPVRPAAPSRPEPATPHPPAPMPPPAERIASTDARASAPVQPTPIAKRLPGSTDGPREPRTASLVTDRARDSHVERRAERIEPIVNPAAPLPVPAPSIERGPALRSAAVPVAERETPRRPSTAGPADEPARTAAPTPSVKTEAIRQRPVAIEVKPSPGGPARPVPRAGDAGSRIDIRIGRVDIVATPPKGSAAKPKARVARATRAARRHQIAPRLPVPPGRW